MHRVLCPMKEDAQFKQKKCKHFVTYFGLSILHRLHRDPPFSCFSYPIVFIGAEECLFSPVQALAFIGLL